LDTLARAAFAFFGAGASALWITATFGTLGRATAACAAVSIAPPDFKAKSVQIESGLRSRSGLSDFGFIGASLGAGKAARFVPLVTVEIAGRPAYVVRAVKASEFKVAPTTNLLLACGGA
jgi:hypothetical protein